MKYLLFTCKLDFYSDYIFYRGRPSCLICLMHVRSYTALPVNYKSVLQLEQKNYVRPLEFGGLNPSFFVIWGGLAPPSPYVEPPLLQRLMEHGVDELAGWMKSNRLLLNPPKTDFLWCATPRRCNQLSTVPLEVCGVRVPPTGTVRDLGILLEADMQMTGHGCKTARQQMLPPATVNQKLYIRSLLFEAAKTAVSCFVITQVDRCNSLLAGAPKCLLDRLQSVLNSAAKLVCNRRSVTM